MKKIIIITGNELRHDFFRKRIALEANITILKTYCEVPLKNLAQNIKEQTNNKLRQEHLATRDQTEIDFFDVFCQKVEDKSSPEFITKGSINSDENVNEILNLNPDLIISFGCSIIQEQLINEFKGKFINIHLGLSPYYRGSGTNFFPFVNKELQYVGVTFMYIDTGIDTGEIIHQIRPTIFLGDNLHQIGNRLIKEMTEMTIKLILNFEKLVFMNPLLVSKSDVKYYKKADFTEDSVINMHKNFSDGLIENYLNNKKNADKNVAIIQNPVLL